MRAEFLHGWSSFQRTAMSGRRTSTNSCSKDVGRGSSSQDFGAEARMSRHRSVAVTVARVDKSKDVGEKTGGGELAPRQTRTDDAELWPGRLEGIGGELQSWRFHRQRRH